MTMLAEILAHKRREVAERKAAFPTPPPCARPPPDFAAAVSADPIGLIAEIKRRSPSVGPLREPFDPSAIARAYASGAAHAISVLMDCRFFGGGEPVFRAARLAVSLPLLYKEVVVDEWQIRHAASLGASAVLLIVAALTDAELGRFLRQAETLGLAALVEVHDETEMKRAIEAGARVIGINNRDLATFRTALETTERLAPLAPPGTLLIAESGVHGPDDARRLKDAGAQALLVGEYLLRSPDIVSALRSLRSL
jgi:indole-3-glycerol phosphate synthase